MGVPGNLHLSTYSHSYLFGSLYQETKNINITHQINHISFGVDKDIGYIKDNIKDAGIVSPLDGVVQVVPEKEKDKEKKESDRLGGMGSIYSYSSYADSAIYEYYTKVVPTTYIPLDR